MSPAICTLFLLAAISLLKRFIRLRRMSSVAVGVLFSTLYALLGPTWSRFGVGGGLEGRFVEDCFRRPGKEEGGVTEDGLPGGPGGVEDGGRGGGGGGFNALFRCLSSLIAAASVRKRPP